MLTLSRLGVVGNLQRLATRCACSAVPENNPRCPGSVVQENGIEDFTVQNEPTYNYLCGSKERKALEAELKKISESCEEVPVIIGGKEYRTKDVRYQVMELVKKAIETACEAQREWDNVPLKDRISIWMKAADMMATTYRQTLNASTMLGQSKTIIQAEIDSAAELIDFIRFNALFAKEVSKYQPLSPEPNVSLNSHRYRGLDGFVAAVSPFNFTAIGGNLAYTPALMGCVTLWKPSDTALLSNYNIFKIMTEAGVPPGVVNFVPTDGPVFGDTITASKNLAGINFTGSVPTFNRLWSQVGKNLDKYRNYPRLIGECGGKNYHFIHPTANVESVVNGTIKSAFEFCGQKCSACSRMYVPESLWPQIKEGLLELRKKLKIGDVQEYDSFTSAVIDDKAFKRISSYIDYAKTNTKVKIIGGGKFDDKKGYFIDPTIIESKDPKDKLMTEEIFGPVLTIYCYPDNKVDDVLKLIDTSTPYALTGAIFAEDSSFCAYALHKLKNSAGNFYINDKSTGSVVAQQPFGGSRMSGTNDKAGGPHYVLRWASPQAIKETFVPIKDWSYPYMSN